MTLQFQNLWGSPAVSLEGLPSHLPIHECPGVRHTSTSPPFSPAVLEVQSVMSLLTWVLMWTDRHTDMYSECCNRLQCALTTSYNSAKLNEHEVQVPNIWPLGIRSIDPFGFSLSYWSQYRKTDCIVLGLHPTVGGAHACQNNKDQTSETTRYFGHVDIVKLAHQHSMLMLAVLIFNTNERHTCLWASFSSCLWFDSILVAWQESAQHRISLTQTLS
jgi:hypothetical protein